jgi:peptidyl-prolyl cis-trans isomerase C
MAPKEPPVVEKPADEPIIVAEIGDYLITRQELEKRLIHDLRMANCPSCSDTGQVDAETVLRNMVAEKAMIMDGRERNLLQNNVRFKEDMEGKLTGLLFQNELAGKITVTEAEISRRMKADPDLDRAKAMRAVQISKYRKAGDEFYEGLYKKLNAEKLRYNFPKAAQTHQRLLLRPAKQRSGYWIQNRQVDEELSEQEKNLILAKYDGGEVTLYEWFRAVCAPAPPKRPRDLGTVEGVERLLDRAMRVPIFVAEAKLRGLDKEPGYVEVVRNREEHDLIGEIRLEIDGKIEDPSKEQMQEYFNKHKEEFKSPDTVKIDQIWCQDLQTARKAKSELDGGADFPAVKQQYSLRKKEQAYNTSSKSERMFFEDLLKGEPNQIVGPVKGFYAGDNPRQPDWQIKWRVVKILQKKPGKLRDYNASVERDVISKLRRRKRAAAFLNYGQELLAKYPHKIYTEKVKDINPLDIP